MEYQTLMKKTMNDQTPRKKRKSMYCDLHHSDSPLASDEELNKPTLTRTQSDGYLSKATQAPSEVMKSNSEENVKSPPMLHLHGQTYVKVMRYRQEPIVNIRQYISDTDGVLHPTKRGILLSQKDWTSLKKEVRNVDKQLKEL
jgi:hypothetical protein